MELTTVDLRPCLQQKQPWLPVFFPSNGSPWQTDSESNLYTTSTQRNLEWLLACAGIMARNRLRAGPGGLGTPASLISFKWHSFHDSVSRKLRWIFAVKIILIISLQDFRAQIITQTFESNFAPMLAPIFALAFTHKHLYNWHLGVPLTWRSMLRIPFWQGLCRNIYILSVRRPKRECSPPILVLQVTSARILLLCVEWPRAVAYFQTK